MIRQALCFSVSLQRALVPPSAQQHSCQHCGRTTVGPDARALCRVIQRRSFSPALRPRGVSNGAGPTAPPPPPNPDASPGAVAEWARATFLAALQSPEDQINLAKVGLLISLEEEAAAQAHRAANDPTALLPDLQILRNHLFRCACLTLLLTCYLASSDTGPCWVHIWHFTAPHNAGHLMPCPSFQGHWHAEHLGLVPVRVYCG